MTTHVVFHELETELDLSSSTFANYACNLIAREYEGKRNVSVLCDNMQDAEAIDEKLWQLPIDRFIPHNLFNEGDGKPSPVEILIMIDGEISKPARNKACLVNFSQQIPPNGRIFHSIYEFVPADDSSKANARKRYSEYKSLGFQLSFLKAAEVN